MRHRLAWLLAALIPLGQTTCSDPSGSVVELQAVLAPDTTCTYQISNPVSSSGYYDPLLDQQQLGYQLVLVARNNMEQAADETYTFGSTNIHWRTRDAIITGWEACWTADPNDYSSYTQTQDVAKGPILDCAALAKVGRGFKLPSSGSVIEGGQTQAVVGTYVLTPSHLVTLFGANFNAAAIPQGYTYTANGVQYYGQGGDAASTSRSAAWGTFPTSGTVNVLVQARATWTTQGGIQGVSNWVTYPITVCPGCLSNACGPLVQGQCYRCPNDEQGCNSSNKCLSDGTTACVSGTGYSGIRPTFGVVGTAACHPEEGYATINCTSPRVLNCQ